MIEFVSTQWWKEHTELGPSTVGDIQMDDILWTAVEEGLLEEVCGDVMTFSSSMQYKFAHDRVQSTVLSLIEDTLAKQYFLAIGKYLLQYYQESPKDRPWLIVMAADLLYQSESIVDSQDERDDYAEVSLLAGMELEANASFKSAAVYCRNSIKFLGEGSFGRKYDLSLRVYNMSAMMESCSGNKAASDNRIDNVLESAHCLDDKYTAYYIRIRSYHEINEFDDGKEAAYRLLREMNVTNVPKKLRLPNVLYEMVSVFRMVDKLSTDELLNRPSTEDHSVAQYTMFMMQGTLCCLGTDKNTLCFLVLRAVKVSLRFGYSTFTPAFFALCGFLRVAITGNFHQGDRIARIGLQLLTRFKAPQADVITKYMYGNALQWLLGSSFDAPQLSHEVRTTAFQCGDSSWGCVAGYAMLSSHFLKGDEPLDKLSLLAADVLEEMRLYGKVTFYNQTQIFRQLVLNLQGQSRDPKLLEGEEVKNLQKFEADLPNTLAYRFSILFQTILAIYFHDTDKAERMASLSTNHLKEDLPFFHTSMTPLNLCLLWSSLFDCRKKSKYQRAFRKAFAIAKKWQALGSRIASVCCSLIGALEKSTFPIKKKSASSDEICAAYNEAILKSTHFGLPSLATIAAERAGMYFAGKNDDMARDFLHRAIQGYQEWQATAKVRDIEERFRHLLTLSLSF